MSVYMGQVLSWNANTCLVFFFQDTLCYFPPSYSDHFAPFWVVRARPFSVSPEMSLSMYLMRMIIEVIGRGQATGS